MRRVEKVGKKFDRLTIIEDLGKNKVVVECDCGTTKETWYSDIKAGKTKSCGCYSKEVSSKVFYKHGLSNTRIHEVWRSMLRRCNNPNRKDYKNYGGRGIKVCKEWEEDFMNFYNWAMKNGYKDNLSIDRIDNDKNYKPSNCQWISINENVRKQTLKNTYKGIDARGVVYYFHNISEFARNHNLDNSTIAKVAKGQLEHHKGWRFEKIS